MHVHMHVLIFAECTLIVTKSARQAGTGRPGATFDDVVRGVVREEPADLRRRPLGCPVRVQRPLSARHRLLDIVTAGMLAAANDVRERPRIVRGAWLGC
jgi:hypothetical protein